MELCESWPRLFDAGVAQALGLSEKPKHEGEPKDETAAPTKRHMGENAKEYANRLKEARAKNEEKIRNRHHGKRIGDGG